MQIITHTLTKLLILLTFSFTITAQTASNVVTTGLDKQVFSAYDFTGESNIIFTTDSANSEVLPSLYIFKYNLLRINDLDKETCYVAYNNFANLTLILNKFASLGYNIASSGINEETTSSSKNYYLVAYVVKKEFTKLEADDTIVADEDTEATNQFSLARKEKFDLKTENNNMASIDFDLAGDSVNYAKAVEKLRFAFESGKYINFINTNNYDTANMIYNQSLLAKGVGKFTAIVSDASDKKDDKDNKVVKEGLVEFVKNNSYEMDKFLTMLNDNEISLLESFASYLYK